MNTCQGAKSFNSEASTRSGLKDFHPLSGRTLLDLKELHFSGVHLKNRSFGPYMALDGVVANNGKHALGEFDVEVTLKDCEDKAKETNCKVVGQARGTATPGVPSGQTRAFNTSDLRFDNLPCEVQVQCGTQPCNAGRVFNWRVILAHEWIDSWCPGAIPLSRSS
jgi:hypothetical protein